MACLFVSGRNNGYWIPRKIEQRPQYITPKNIRGPSTTVQRLLEKTKTKHKCGQRSKDERFTRRQLPGLAYPGSQSPLLVSTTQPDLPRTIYFFRRLLSPCAPSPSSSSPAPSSLALPQVRRVNGKVSDTSNVKTCVTLNNVDVAKPMVWYTLVTL